MTPTEPSTPASGKRPNPNVRIVLVHVANSLMEAYAIRSRLEAEGIPVFLKGESEGPYRFAYGPVYLSVPEDVEVQARLVVADTR